jgi:glycosyltransferase involved in cell wall biosynthesis
MDKIALLYDDSGYVETLRAQGPAVPGAPVGLMGRQVAGREFLDAFLSFGSWNELAVVVRDSANAESLVRFCQEHPTSQHRQRRLRFILEREFSRQFFPTAPASPLYLPAPPDSRFTWARQHGGPHAFALCGVTHTLSSTRAVQQLCSLVTDPFQPYDVLICTSRAVVDMVRAVTGTYAEYLRDRFGGSPQAQIRLETVPLAVNPEKFRPATPQEHAACRQKFDIRPDEVAVLFVGRLSHHAKAHPYPMYAGLARAAQQTGKKVHLVLAGWAASPAIQQAFVDGARALAPGVRVSFVDGTNPDVRFTVWQAADLFTSLSDNIQETFGLVIIEAMACGVPVVSTDWDGYRDLVIDGQTGLLVPTLMVAGATNSTAARLLFGEINYDHYLAECSQATVVDVAAAAAAYARLLVDEDLRRSMGVTGRQHVLERFTWEKVMRAYESLWHSQEQQRKAVLSATSPPWKIRAVPSAYPPPECSFASYPTFWLRDEDLVQAVPEAAGQLEVLLRLPLTNHSAQARCGDVQGLHAVLQAAETVCSLARLEEQFVWAGTARETGRATVAWMLKYGLLRVVREVKANPAPDTTGR